MGILSITSPGKTRTYVGLLSDFVVDNRVWQPYQIVAPSDTPSVTYTGDGVSNFTALIAAGQAKYRRATVINSTAAGTVANVTTGLKSGLITTTSAAAQNIPLPTATQIATAFKAVSGTSFEFVIDNSTGVSVVTVVVAAGITVPPAVITGSNTLTVAAGSVGVFRLYFTSATAALLSRVQ